MSNHSPASKFIEESVNHPEWLKTIEAAQASEIVQLAKTHGFEVSLEDLKSAAKELLNGNPSKEQIDEAASGLSDFQNDTGYGDDTGYAALYGVAGMILKLA